MSEKCVITVDPGFQGTGWASWSINDWSRTVGPVNYGVIKPQKTGDLEERGRSLFRQLIALPINGFKAVFIEWPQFFATSGIGHTTASTGSLGALYLAASTVAAAAWSCSIPAVFIPVTDWKGQLSKKQVTWNISQQLKCPRNTFPNHVADAVGIGLYLKSRESHYGKGTITNV